MEMLWKGAGVLLMAAGLYYGIAHRVDALGDRVDTTNEKVMDLANSVKEIRQSLPNREADKLIVSGLADRVSKLESGYDKIETYMINVREKLARKGIL